MGQGHVSAIGNLEPKILAFSDFNALSSHSSEDIDSLNCVDPSERIGRVKIFGEYQYIRVGDFPESMLVPEDEGKDTNNEHPFKGSIEQFYELENNESMHLYDNETQLYNNETDKIRQNSLFYDEPENDIFGDLYGDSKTNLDTSCNYEYEDRSIFRGRSPQRINNYDHYENDMQYPEETETVGNLQDMNMDIQQFEEYDRTL